MTIFGMPLFLWLLGILSGGVMGLVLSIHVDRREQEAYASALAGLPRGPRRLPEPRPERDDREPLERLLDDERRKRQIRLLGR